MKEKIILRITVYDDCYHILVNNFELDSIDVYESDTINDSISRISFYFSCDSAIYFGTIKKVSLINSKNEEFDLGVPVAYSYNCPAHYIKSLDLFYEVE